MNCLSTMRTPSPTALASVAPAAYTTARSRLSKTGKSSFRSDSLPRRSASSISLRERLRKLSKSAAVRR